MSEPAIRLDAVGKMYKIFPTRFGNFLNVAGLHRLLPGKRGAYREFWALRGIDLEVPKGGRIGVIGRNGAGKTTMLKLLTGNIAPTEGEVEVVGSVRALMDAAAGFHPEFTGYENLRAALTLQGLTGHEMEEATAEIAEFTELGEYLTQPFRTYSAGMQARLAFATATVIRPDILIVDEMLSAGDAYFLSKSSERMRGLVSGGVTLLLVSHALDQVLMFCEETIWLERGQIVQRGPTLEVIKAYQQFSRRLDERRLMAKNRNRSFRDSRGPLDEHGETFLVHVEAPAGAAVRGITLLRDGELEERIAVGGPQDADPSHAAYVDAVGGGWGPPDAAAERSRAIRATGPADAYFDLIAVFESSVYEVDVEYRAEPGATVTLRVEHQGEERAVGSFAGTGAWANARVELTPAPAAGGPRRPSRWPGEGSLAIGEVRVVDEEGRERALLHVGQRARVSVAVVAREGGSYPLVPALTLYRLDGVLVSNHVGPPLTVELEQGEAQELVLDFGRLNLGDGGYVFTVALYRRLDAVGVAETYDLVDRSYEFEVVGNEPFANGVFTHPSEWRLLEPARGVEAATRARS